MLELLTINVGAASRERAERILGWLTERSEQAGFLPFEFGFLETLETRGLIDSHRHHAPEDRPHSWIGRTGDGYRYDYFHVAENLRERITSSRYLHETRDLQLTDHAAVSLALDVVRARSEVSALTASEDLPLF